MQFELNGPTTVYHIQDLTIKCFGDFVTVLTLKSLRKTLEIPE